MCGGVEEMVEEKGRLALTWHSISHRPPRPRREPLQPQGPNREQVRADPAGLDGEKGRGGTVTRKEDRRGTQE